MQAKYGSELIEDCNMCPIRGRDFFCNLSAVAIQAFANLKLTTAYPSQAVLFVEGQAPRGVYMLCKGRVKLTTTSADGRPLIVRICDPGEVLGLHATVSNQPYELTAETLERCQVNFVRRDDFVRLLKEHQEVSSLVMQQLSAGYRKVCEEIRYLGLRSASERVARFLVETSANARQTGQGKRFHLGLTHEEISQVVGLRRETVTRAMTDLKDKMLIAIQGSMVVIRDESALRAQASAA